MVEKEGKVFAYITFLVICANSVRLYLVFLHFILDHIVWHTKPVSVGAVICRNLFKAVSLTPRWWHILLACAQGLVRISPENSTVTLWILNFFVPSHPSSESPFQLFWIVLPAFLHAYLFHPLIPLSFLLHVSPVSILQPLTLLGPSHCIFGNRCPISVKWSRHAVPPPTNQGAPWQELIRCHHRKWKVNRQ